MGSLRAVALEVGEQLVRDKAKPRPHSNGRNVSGVQEQVDLAPRHGEIARRLVNCEERG
jgi:hypothetical protein